MLLQMAQETIQVKLSRELTLFDITMIGVAGMIGAGVFALTSIAAGVAGPALILAFFLNGVVATVTAAAYAELGSALPEAGGGYVWIKEMLPEPFGFLAGWVDWFAHSVACSLYAVAFGAFFAEAILPFIPISRLFLAKLSTFLAITFLTYINFKGAKESGRVGGFVTVLKVAVLLVFVAFGIYRTFTLPNWATNFETPSFAPTGIAGILAAMGLTYIAFEGYEIIVQSGEETKNPEKNIPRAVFVSLWIAVIIYVLVAFSVIGATTTPDGSPSWMYLGQLKELGLIKVANQIMPFGTAILLFAGLVSTVSAMNATIYSSSRVSFAMARDGLLPGKLSAVHAKNRTPHYAIFSSYVIITLMALALPIEAVAASTDIMFLLLFMQVNAVLIVSRLRSPELKRSFKVPFVPYTPIAAIVLQIVIGYFLITEVEHGYLALLSSAVWIVLGMLVYFAYSKEKEKEKMKEELRTVYEERAVEEEMHRIIVPVAHPKTAEKLVTFANTIAKAKNSELVLLSIIVLPQQTPLSAGRRYVAKHKEMLSDLMKKVDVPVSGVIKVGHNVAQAILNTIDEEKANMVILGWRGRTFRRDFILGSTIDPILLKASCNVVVARFEPDLDVENIRRILIPTAGGPHAELAAEIAMDLHKILGSEITLLYVAGSEDEKTKAERYIEQTRKVIDFDVKETIKISRDRIEAIAIESLKYDILILGATNEPFLKNFIKGVFPEKVARKTPRTVVMVRKKIAVKDILRLR